ncbi:hypothetical protein K1719_046647 [Acacia pycnantha]|nr:hypothetical protein K1719_046647 [Acacia pycnantha]
MAPNPRVVAAYRAMIVLAYEMTVLAYGGFKAGIISVILENIVNDVGDTFVQCSSNLDFDESFTSCPDSPSISWVQLYIEIQLKS